MNSIPAWQDHTSTRDGAKQVSINNLLARFGLCCERHACRRQIKARRQGITLQPEAQSSGWVQPPLVQKRLEFAVGGIILGAQLQDKKRLFHGSNGCQSLAQIRASLPHSADTY